MRHAREYQITGHVQGVGFRWTAKRLADAFKLAGWVRNNPDGSVSLTIEGEEWKCNSFMDELSSTMGRSIATMSRRDVKPGKNPDGFDVVR